MAKSKSQLKQELQGKQPEWKVSDGDDDYWGHGNTIAIQKGHVFTDYYSHEKNWDYSTIMEMSVVQEETCCGFFQLSGFFDPNGRDNKAFLRQHMDDLAKEISKRFKKYIFLAAYVPNTKKYKLVKELLLKVGFVPGVTLKTKHDARYTNTRWEWFGPKYKEVKREKIVRSISS